MNCPDCGRDLKKDFLRVYKLGLQDGQNEYLKHLNKIEHTMGHLFRELRVMDVRTPDKVNRVYFSREFISRVVIFLKKKGAYYWAKILEREMKKQIGNTLSEEAKLRELLSEIEE